MVKRFLLLDVDRTVKAHLPIGSNDSHAALKKLELSPKLVTFANRDLKGEETKRESKNQPSAKHYDAALFCTHRLLQLVQTTMELHQGILSKVCVSGENRDALNILLHRVIENFAAVTGLPILAVSTPDDDFQENVGDAFKRGIYPYECQVAATRQYPDDQNFIKERDFKCYEEVPSPHKNKQLADLFKYLEQHHPHNEEIEMDFVDDNEVILSEAEKIDPADIPSGMTLNIYHHDAQIQSDVKLRKSIKGTGLRHQQQIDKTFPPRIFPKDTKEQLIMRLIHQAFFFLDDEITDQVKSYSKACLDVFAFLSKLEEKTLAILNKNIGILTANLVLQENQPEGPCCFLKKPPREKFSLVLEETNFTYDLTNLMRTTVSAHRKNSFFPVNELPDSDDKEIELQLSP